MPRKNQHEEQWTVDFNMDKFTKPGIYRLTEQGHSIAAYPRRSTCL